MISTERHGSVLVLSMDDGENRFSLDSLAEWEAVLDEVEADEAVSALVTTGAGKFYSNGLDVAVLSGPDAGTYVTRVVTLLARTLALPVVTVAAVNGHAFGAGAMMVLAHDLRVMREDRGYFCLPEVDLGLPFMPIMSSLVMTKLPPRTSQEAMTLGPRYGGKQALEEGIAHAVATEDQLLAQALELAGRHGGKNRATLGAIKADVYAGVLQHRP
jgi:Delta3-Delta2-enoyl-CoA isomerase